jgi:hypothetical protein
MVSFSRDHPRLVCSNDFKDATGDNEPAAIQVFAGLFRRRACVGAVVRWFGYSAAAFMLCYDFRRGQLPDFLPRSGQGHDSNPGRNKGRDIFRGAAQAKLFDLRHKSCTQSARDASRRDRCAENGVVITIVWND